MFCLTRIHPYNPNFYQLVEVRNLMGDQLGPTWIRKYLQTLETLLPNTSFHKWMFSWNLWLSMQGLKQAVGKAVLNISSTNQFQLPLPSQTRSSAPASSSAQNTKVSWPLDFLTGVDMRLSLIDFSVYTWEKLGLGVGKLRTLEIESGFCTSLLGTFRVWSAL